MTAPKALTLLFSSLALSLGAPSNALASAEHIKLCFSTTIDDKTSSGSPLIADCAQMATNIANDGTWTFESVYQRQLVQYGSCAFGIKTVEALPGLLTIIGNGDIVDAVNGSIELFSWNGLVGASGQTACPEWSATFGPVRVEWGLYHT